MIVKNNKQLECLKEAGKINYLTHKHLEKHIKVGVTTSFLNEIANEFIKMHNASPSFLNYNGFPASICCSLNDEVVHGIPSNKKLKDGDIISIDIGVCYKGYHSDSANTYIVGSASKEISDLVENTKKSLYLGLDKIKDGVKVSEIGKAIEGFAHKNNLSIIRELVGHGVGTKVHEYPDVPNYYTDSKVTLVTGMVIAVEPMLNLGKRDIYLDDDDWTIKTKDKKPSAHFEHTVMVTKDGCVILTGE